MTKRLEGTVESREWPERLTGRVVDPGSQPRIHGYDVERDLAPHYGASASLLLALTGELPREDQLRAFEVAAAFVAPVHVGEAPAHAAVLARLCGAGGPGVIATAVVGLAEQARLEVSEHAALVAALVRGGELESLDPRFVSEDPMERDRASRLDAALRVHDIQIGPLQLPLSRTAAILTAFVFAGLVTEDQLVAGLVWSRFGCAVAEGISSVPGSFADYPAELPPFRYEGGP